MGQWHNIKELSEIIQKIKIDTPIFEIYDDEIMSNKTYATFHDWYNNLKVRVKKYFKVDLRSLIPKWTKHNKIYRDNWESIKIRNMVEINLKIENIFKDLDSNITPLNVAFKMIVELLSLTINTKFESNRIKVLFVYYWKKYIPKLNLRKTFKLLNLSKSTYYDNVKKIIDGVIYDRKIRTDSKVDDIKYQTKAIQINKEIKNMLGIDKTTYLFNSSKYKPNLIVSPKTMGKIFRKLNIVTKPGSSFINHKRYKENKNTNFISENLLTPDFIKQSGPRKIYSTDYTLIKHEEFNHIHILGIIDVNSFEVPYLKVFPNQSKKDVINMINSVCNIEVIHSDNGAEFKSNDVINLCKGKGIRQSFSKPGCSTQNRWIEYFWGRLKMECLNHKINIKNLSIAQIQRILDEYREFWNNQRPIKIVIEENEKKKFAYLTPSSLAK